MTKLSPEEINQVLIENRRMRMALEKISRWHDEFPPAKDIDGNPCSYEGTYGSNGARDYMRGIARRALGER